MPKNALQGFALQGIFAEESRMQTVKNRVCFRLVKAGRTG